MSEGDVFSPKLQCFEALREFLNRDSMKVLLTPTAIQRYDDQFSVNSFVYGPQKIRTL
jgi:hypothetical protein